MGEWGNGVPDVERVMKLGVSGKSDGAKLV